MSKSTLTTTEVTKAPKTIPLREALPWFIVAIMTFAIAGIVSGWFIRSNVSAMTVQTTSKEQSR
ncbi:hypothetical protein AHiyo8_59060 [Arthrobacter sp. Hiyo8]|uniref:hypothetical protein n=1 Tax=Arthrobacter sp. Hiyo1 TaxID=1588020 RepID=UPI0006839FF6|nr:hypothetical protein [Arthrobacter sp. Hiyo1]BAS17603.1 hypothetical protein AHiyo8_59060 [Arthrobacter sp. Hiyo8]GAP57961.1 hypothetical protein AHiyo1_09230 [Arthrobacter sp. Hiyo1]